MEIGLLPSCMNAHFSCYSYQQVISFIRVVPELNKMKKSAVKHIGK